MYTKSMQTNKQTSKETKNEINLSINTDVTRRSPGPTIAVPKLKKGLVLDSVHNV